ncbi:MAG: hypothetical protein AVDCRST_MAG86-2004 [uncultured Truepera sp.]|uniref:Uncharacterized protein n=1 Tax=uncultured Truepera sp. TaxID=543023 RepID=A0A6J4VB47_9DEIN|nr:MAG: hypothetical protein AVDCRST_MAG86-2004 [uncultured Truepera sp.]
MTTTATTTRPVSYRRLLLGALTAAAAATLLNTLLYFDGRILGAFPPTLLVQGEPFSVVAVVLFSFFPVLVAALVFALLARFVPRPKRVFYIVAAVVFALMFFTPFTIPAALTLTIVVLELMHVVAAASSVWAVRQA